MITSTLADLQGRITERLDRLQAADPRTLSPSMGDHFEEDHEVRNLVREATRGASAADQERIEREYFGAGPLEPLLADPEVTEIILNGGDSLWFEKSGVLKRHDDRFLSPLTFRNFIARMSRDAGIMASIDCPFADGRWRGCRVHLITPPASGDHAVVTLRRHPANPWTLEKLEGLGWASAGAMKALRSLVAERMNFLVIGCTGSGKTSVLNACLGMLGQSERAVIIEDTSELTAPNLASTKLLTRRDPHGQLREIDQSELLKQALRMRPDRLIMGEIRGAEAKDLLMAFATGHSGCMGTLHADSARQALLRLEMLVQLGAPQWSLHAVRTLILLSLHAVVVVGRTEGGGRRLEGIYRIASLEDIGFLIEKTT